jgi:hypothetical protein
MMAESSSLDEVLSRAVSCSDGADTFDTKTLATIDNLLPGKDAGAFPKSAPRSRMVFVDRSILDSMMHLPRDKAAQMLGVCSTTFKKVCRRAGLKEWPYRRPLLDTIHEGDAPLSFSRASSAPSAFQETPNLLASCAYSSPGRFLSAFSSYHASPPPTASLPMMPMRYIHMAPVSSPSVSSSSDVSFLCSDDCFSYLAISPAPTPEQSTHVVDAVMDYLDTLSSGCAATEDMTAAHRCELEAVVQGLDLES